MIIRYKRALPLLVLHRQDWGILRPYVKLNADDDIELKDLKTANVYCAGFTDSAIKNRSDLYDIFVDGMETTVNNTIVLWLMSHISFLS